jgi:hypothetical protein
MGEGGWKEVEAWSSINHSVLSGHNTGVAGGMRFLFDMTIEVFEEYNHCKHEENTLLRNMLTRVFKDGSVPSD